MIEDPLRRVGKPGSPEDNRQAQNGFLLLDTFYWTPSSASASPQDDLDDWDSSCASFSSLMHCS